MKYNAESMPENGKDVLSALPAKTSHLVNSAFHSVLITMMLTIVAFTIAMLIDSIITGNVLGPVALAAAGVVAPIQLVPLTIVGVLQIGGVALIMRYLGMEQIQKAVDLFTVISVLCIIIGVVLTCVFYFFSHPIALLLGAKGEVIALASSYIKGLALGMIPILIGHYLLFMVRIDGYSKLCIICVLVIAAVNVVLDLYFSIVLQWGMFGMALATSISHAVGAVICLVPFLSKKRIFHFHFYRSQREPGIITKTFKMGSPTAVVRIANLLFIIVMNNILFVEGMVAFNIQSSVSGLNAALYSGVGQTVAVMVSLYYGEMDKRSIKDIVKISLKSGAIIGACSAVVFLIFSQTVVRIFAITDPQVFDISIRAINLFVISLPIQIAMHAIASFYQSIEKTMVSSVLTVLFLLVMPLVWIFTFRPLMGDDAIWSSLSGGALFTLLLMPVIIFIISKKFPKSMDDYMMLSIPQSQTFIRSMKTSLNEVAITSKQIEEFCLSAGADAQSSANAALAMQETVKNIVTHGYANKDSHYVDIRVVIQPETILVRIKDNAMAFDPTSCLNPESEHACANGGIQRVNAIAQQIDYKNTIGMNCLLVTILRKLPFCETV